MTTDVAVRDERPDSLAHPTPVLTSLADWASELTAAHTLAETLCKTAFVPDHFRNKPAETAAAILSGFELGFSPMAAVRSIFIIKGTPGMYAKAMVALLQSKGHDVWVEEQSDERVVVCGRRRGSQKVHSTTWDRARVVKAKLESNAKYQETPQQMMVARGQSEICRQVGADVLHGVAYSVEELEDMPPIQATATVGARVTADEIVAKAPAVRDEAVPAIEPTDSPSQAAVKRMFALLKEHGMGDKEPALVFIRETIGREITTRAELTRAEVAVVCDALTNPPDARPDDAARAE